VQDLIVAVDIGTTSTKAVVYGAQGAAHGSDDRGYPLLEPQPGWAVQDPLQVTAAALEAARASLSGGAGVASGTPLVIGDGDGPLANLGLAELAETEVKLGALLPVQSG
jgi:gluconokinase